MFTLYMDDKITFINIATLTLFTGKSFLSFGMCEFMFFNTPFDCSTIIALTARERFLSSMTTLMSLQITF